MQEFIYTQFPQTQTHNITQQIHQVHTAYSSNRLSDSLLSRQSRLAELRSGIGLTMEINGNTTIAAGDMIDVQLPIAGIDHDDDKVDKYYSGVYLITNLRHIFVPRERTHQILLITC